MDMLSGAQITAAGLTDWRKLGQALHARFVIRDLRRRGPAPGPRVDAGALYFVWGVDEWTPYVAEAIVGVGIIVAALWHRSSHRSGGQ